MRTPIAFAALGLWTCLGGGAYGQEEDKTAVTLMYTGPEDLKNAEIARFDFRKYEAGEALYVASHNSNLREKPDAKSAAVATLPMAAKVKVLKSAGGPTTIVGKVDRWYQVEVLEPDSAKGKQGYLFGMVLTPAAYQVDLDGDGEHEIVTVAFAQNFKIRVRVREPKLETPESVSLDLDAAGGAYVSQQGGLAEVSLVPREKAGVDLVQVFAHVEACADFATRWVSYTVPGGRPGVAGEAKLAMTQAGVADSPLHSNYQVTWDPKARTATAVQTTTEEDESGKSTTEKTTRRYKLQDGVYQEVK